MEKKLNRNVCMKFSLFVWVVMNFCNFSDFSIQMLFRKEMKRNYADKSTIVIKKTKAGYVNAAVPSVKASTYDWAKTRIKMILAAHVASRLECIIRNATCVKWMHGCDVFNRKVKTMRINVAQTFPRTGSTSIVCCIWNRKSINFSAIVYTQNTKA